jgi:hypothetical protein
MSARIVDVMAGVAQLRELDIVAIQEIEAISLNAAYQIRDFLLRERIGSVIIVTPGFRSRRSALVYGRVLGRGRARRVLRPGVRHPNGGHLEPHVARRAAVAEQYLKLEYYRFYILPYRVLEQRDGEASNSGAGQDA